MGEAEKMVAGMKPIRVIEWNMLNKQKYLGANFASVMGMRFAFHPLQVMQNRISMGDEARAYSGSKLIGNDFPAATEQSIVHSNRMHLCSLCFGCPTTLHGSMRMRMNNSRHKKFKLHFPIN